MLGRLAQWVEDRSGAISATLAFLNEQIPRSAGWRNTLGSVAGALILGQILTGFLLMLYYVPHPEAAYESIQYVEESVAAGGLVRALHYWGASFVVVALFVHACRVFFSGAYRKPRELTWLVGLALFGIVITIAFTGQLLPFNQAGYWAAKVGIEIASSAPIAGPYIHDLMLGGDVVGAATLTRFYALHVVLLPGLLGLLVVFHLYLLRRHGPMATADDEPAATVAFFPTQLFKDMVAISIVLAGLIAVAYAIGGPESGPADPEDTSYLPHPEWYLMAHYQLLRITPGNLEILTTFVMPTVFALLLLALPWLDRGKSARLADRRITVSIGAAVIAAIVALTAIGTASVPEQETQTPPATQTAAATDQADDTAAGRSLYIEQGCAVCHRIGDEGRKRGPNLTHVGDRLKRDYMIAWLRDPEAIEPDTIMPAFEGSEAELEQLVNYLQSLKRD